MISYTKNEMISNSFLFTECLSDSEREATTIERRHA